MDENEDIELIALENLESSMAKLRQAVNEYESGVKEYMMVANEFLDEVEKTKEIVDDFVMSVEKVKTSIANDEALNAVDSSNWYVSDSDVEDSEISHIPATRKSSIQRSAPVSRKLVDKVEAKPTAKRETFNELMYRIMLPSNSHAVPK